MKRKIILHSALCLLPFAFCLLSFKSNAQVFIIGGKGILNYSTLMNDNPTLYGHRLENKFTLGGQGGMFLRWYFNDATYYSNTNISIAGEILFGGYGQKYKAHNSDSANVDAKISISSLDIPVMVHVRGQAGLYCEAGVSFGFISGVKMDYARSPADTSAPDFSGVSANSSFTSNNLSGIFGFGIDSELNDKLNLTIGFRLTYGLTDLAEPNKISTDYKETHSATVGFVVGVAYILNFFHDYH